MFVTVLAKLVPLFFKSEHALFFLCSQNCLFWKWHRYFQNLLITPLLLLKFPYPKISAFVKKNLVISFMLHLWRVDSRVLNWIVPIESDILIFRLGMEDTTLTLEQVEHMLPAPRTISSVRIREFDDTTANPEPIVQDEEEADQLLEEFLSPSKLVSTCNHSFCWQFLSFLLCFTFSHFLLQSLLNWSESGCKWWQLTKLLLYNYPQKN